jgi:hypothetical protein
MLSLLRHIAGSLSSPQRRRKSPMECFHTWCRSNHNIHAGLPLATVKVLVSLPVQTRHAGSTRGGVLHAGLLLERLWHFDGKAWAAQTVSGSGRSGRCEGVIPARQARVQVMTRLVVVCEARHTYISDVSTPGRARARGGVGVARLRRGERGRAGRAVVVAGVRLVCADGALAA